MKTEEKTQVSAVGFEPGTFRSCVEHSIHYATETPPIPDVLLVLVAPKHIHRNVTTTLQSRFTQPHPTGHTLELYYYYYYYFYFLIIFFLFDLFIYLFIFYYFFLFFLFFLCVKLLNTSHCSPTPLRIWRKKFGLCRFFNIFLQISYLLT